MCSKANAVLSLLTKNWTSRWRSSRAFKQRLEEMERERNTIKRAKSTTIAWIDFVLFKPKILMYIIRAFEPKKKQPTVHDYFSSYLHIWPINRRTQFTTNYQHSHSNNDGKRQRKNKFNPIYSIRTCFA